MALRHGLIATRTVAGAALLLLAAAATAEDVLRANFTTPPASARPWVYWFPLDGNITSNGITADLEAMARVGIGGVLYMETAQGTPTGPVPFASDAWFALMKHACNEAARLGLQINMNNDAGWNGSGGPWITPEQSMKRVVWSETVLTGPAQAPIALPQPLTERDYYRDIAVIAYPTSEHTARIPHLSGKTLALREVIALRSSFPALPPTAVIPHQALTNLTAFLTKDGTLAWNAPAGAWTVLRIGYTTTGKENHPAPDGGRGLECDKLSKDALDIHFNALMGKLVEQNHTQTGPGKTFVRTHIDSWEIRSQNWTQDLPDQFRRLRGYDLLPWLPVMTGRIIDSAELSERFLWDFRQTLCELLLENYADHARERAHRAGLELSVEAYGNGPFDDLAYGGRADEPMSEFWSWDRFGEDTTCLAMASAAHVYGKPILGAEAFTANAKEKWQGHPGNIKDLGDWAFCAGINRFVFHRYALQPWDNVRPGVSMGPWGLHYERTQTWWEQSHAWHTYLARCQSLLQQGLCVADLCFLQPENAPQGFVSPVKQDRERPGHAFDGCPPEVVLTRMSVRNGRLTLPDGMSYQMLVLPRVAAMTPSLLRKLRDLIADGATVLGNPPTRAPGLADYPRCDDEVRSLAREIWGDSPPPAACAERAFGRGRVIWGRELLPPPDAVYEPYPALPSASWIWSDESGAVTHAPPGIRYFRQTFTLTDTNTIASARLVMTADNKFDCWLNGQPAGRGWRVDTGYGMDVRAWLKPGTNFLAVIAENKGASKNPAGLTGALTVHFTDGSRLDWVTDGTWSVAKDVQEDWRNTLSTHGWSAARVLGPFGMAPWGFVDESAGSAYDAIPEMNTVSRALERLNLAPDFACTGVQPGEEPRYIHKRVDSADLYFVANKTNAQQTIVCAFRVTGRQPELWWPETGKTEPSAAYQSDGMTTHLPLHLPPYGSVFVVFRQPTEKSDPVLTLARDGEAVALCGTNRPPDITLTCEEQGNLLLETEHPGHYTVTTASGKTLAAEIPAALPPMEINGPWELAFAPGGGAPAQVTLPALISWSEHSDPGVRYFSGTAIYRKTFTVPPALLEKNCRIDLDLGRVEIMADITLNGQSFTTLWKTPYATEVTRALRAGTNEMTISVVNLWINRMIGDEFLPDDSSRKKSGWEGQTLTVWPDWLLAGKPSPAGRFTFTSHRLWKKEDSLAPSGLMGPVVLRPIERVLLKPSL